MDYRQLLKKYIHHVGEEEVEFTPEEWAKLEELESESLAISSVTHSCSCHAKGDGPCGICQELGCEVFNFNRVASGIVVDGLYVPEHAFYGNSHIGDVWKHNHNEYVQEAIFFGGAMDNDEPHRCSGKRCRECVAPPLTQEDIFLRGTDRVLSERAEQREQRPFFSVREFLKSREPIGTIDDIREIPDGIEVDFTISSQDRHIPEYVDNSFAYFGEYGTHGVYGIIGKDFGHQFCDIVGCYGTHDDCKLK